MRGRVDRCQSLGCTVASPASVRKDKDESERTAKLDTAVRSTLLIGQNRLRHLPKSALS